MLRFGMLTAPELIAERDALLAQRAEIDAGIVGLDLKLAMVRQAYREKVLASARAREITQTNAASLLGIKQAAVSAYLRRHPTPQQ